MGNVLFAEDSPGCQLAISVALRTSGFKVTIVPDGLAVLDYLERSRPDLILLDLGMPQANGIEVLGRLRSKPLWATIPVIVFTASTDAALRAKAEELGVQGFFIKSRVSIQQLLAAVRKYATGTTAATLEARGLCIKQFARANGGQAMGEPS